MSPVLPCSRWGLPSSISCLMDWCAFTAPFHLYNARTRCSLLSVALSIALPLLGVTQHPAPWSPDFPHPDFRTRPSTQLKCSLRIPYIGSVGNTNWRAARQHHLLYILNLLNKNGTYTTIYASCASPICITIVKIYEQPLVAPQLVHR